MKHHRTRTSVFIGVTSSNSAMFLDHSLPAIVERSRGVSYRLMLIDNASKDESVSIARQHGADIVVRPCSQPDALNFLVQAAREEYTLLVHADVILLNDDWFDLCVAQLAGSTILLSPEDIGCGPFTRPFGKDMPESSFMFFRTEALKRLRKWRFDGWRRLRLPRRCVDFYGPHVTHHLPSRLASMGLCWAKMHVHTSDHLPEQRYGPYPGQGIWTDELGHLRYGLGNFYSVAGKITHYHNWYDRVPALNRQASTEAPRRNFPLDYIRAYTQAFLHDHQAGRLVIPPAMPTDRQPIAL